ncbi:MAG: hypothetical protein WC761_00655 [Candidatus Paceibacterota bacterium]|jgi:hypothetical protein
MFRILSASKDTYITNKYIAGTRSLGSNVGQAGTLDLFKLYNETFISVSASVSGVIEQSRLLVQFDLAPLVALTASKLNITDASFKCYLNLKDVYGGQTTPSNFTIRLMPLSKSWDEGRGSDVIAFRDLDIANYVTASVSGGAPDIWNTQGAGASGSLDATNLDVVTSGNLGSGLIDLTVSQFFTRGDEDLLMDVTTLVSAAICGRLPNKGWRISFSETEENDTTTRFVKRFGTRHTNDKTLRPKLLVKYNDRIRDDSGELEFNSAQTVFFYNFVNGTYTNFVSGASSITGSNSSILRLIASKSIAYATSSWSISHSASINHTTRSLYVITQSFSASQYAINSFAQTGIYSSSINLNLATNTIVRDFMSGGLEQKFRFELVSVDGTFPYANGYYTFKSPLGGTSNVRERNWVTNITNLKQTYTNAETSRLRVFVQDYNTDYIAQRVVSPTKSVILTNLKWRLIKAYSKDIVIPFDDVATLCSTDADGMYFDFYMADLDPGEVYEFELMITENGSDYYINNAGFRFRVMP